jgi:hypothetical protein
VSTRFAASANRGFEFEKRG